MNNPFLLHLAIKIETELQTYHVTLSIKIVEATSTQTYTNVGTRPNISRKSHFRPELLIKRSISAIMSTDCINVKVEELYSIRG